MYQVHHIICLLSAIAMVLSKAGTIQPAVDTTRMWYDTYSIRYTCTLLKVSKSRILDFNDKVNILGWSIQ